MAAVLFTGSGASEPLGIPTSQSFVDEFIGGLADKEYEREYVTVVRDRLANSYPAETDLEAVMSVLGMVGSPDFEGAIRSAAGPALSYAFGTRDIYPDAPAERGAARRVFRLLKEYIRSRCLSIEAGRAVELYDPIVQGLWAEGQPWTVGGRDQSLGSQDEGHGQIPHVFCYTTNYDCGLEAYCQRKRISYTRGFTHQAGPPILSPDEIHRNNPWKIIKLHGSVDMYRMGDGTIRESEIAPAAPGGRTPSGTPIEEDLLIYPVHEKELFEFPFLDLFHDFAIRLRNAPLWCFVGFSFRDEPINRILRREADADKKMLVIGPSASRIANEKLSDLRCRVIPLDVRVGDPDLQDRIVDQRTV